MIERPRYDAALKGPEIINERMSATQAPGRLRLSLDWLKGKSRGNHGIFCMKSPGFRAIFSSNQSRETDCNQDPEMPVIQTMTINVSAAEVFQMNSRDTHPYTHLMCEKNRFTPGTGFLICLKMRKKSGFWSVESCFFQHVSTMKLWNILNSLRNRLVFPWFSYVFLRSSTADSLCDLPGRFSRGTTSWPPAGNPGFFVGKWVHWLRIHGDPLGGRWWSDTELIELLKIWENNVI